MRGHWLPRPAALLVAAAATFGCGAPASSAPCLTDIPQILTFPFQRFEHVSHEAEGGTELARFAFDAASQGEVTVTVEPAAPPYIEFSTNQPIDVQGHQLWSVRIDDLVGGAATDRVRADPLETHLIRDIVQVVDAEALRWVVGTAAGACVRLGDSADATFVVLHVSADQD